MSKSNGKKNQEAPKKVQEVKPLEVVSPEVSAPAMDVPAHDPELHSHGNEVEAQPEAPVVNEEQQAPESQEAPAQDSAPLDVVDKPQRAGEDKNASNPEVVDSAAQEKFDLSKPIVRDIATLSAVRKQIMIDLQAARKDDDGHALVKELEKQLEQVDRELLPLKEEVLRKQEKLKASQEIGATRPIIVQPKVVPPSTNLINDSQIPAMFKLKLRAPSSVAFDMVKVCDIFEEAAHDLYFAYNSNAPVIQEGIKALAELCEQICEVMKEDEEKRLEVEAKKNK